jgi:hypothetical protein
MRHQRAAVELKELEELFAKIDAAYAERADVYGFGCSGCDQTCCSERFHHHTLAEILLLEKGIAGLDAEKRGLFFTRAAEAVRCADSSRTVLCPLYTEEGCGLYASRPLICRLHGIPYDYAPPGKAPQRGGGCHRFDDEIESAGTPYIPFERTVWFSGMADIEIALRRRLKYGKRLSMTVAEILAGMEEIFRL